MDTIARNSLEFQAPHLPKAALIGLAGRFVELFSGTASPCTLLLTFLAYVGALLGRSSYVRFLGHTIYANIFVLIVSTLYDELIATQDVNKFLAPFEPFRIVDGGLSNLLSLVFSLRDDYTRLERMAREPGDAPVLVPTLAYAAEPERRAIITQRIIGVTSPKTVAATGLRHGLMRLFDGADLRVFAGLRDGVITASGAHVAIATACSPKEFLSMNQELMALFLLCTSDVTALIRSVATFKAPADESELVELQVALADALLGNSGEVTLSTAATDRILHEAAKVTTPSSLFLTKVLKIGLLNARCAASPQIEPHHLQAGFELVRYAYEVEIFLRRQVEDCAAKDRVANKIIVALQRAQAGLTMTEIHRALGNHVRRNVVAAALRELEQSGHVRPDEGRPRRVWRAIRAREAD